MEVLDRIDLIQKDANMTREVFAQKTGIGYSRLNNIFSGRAKIRHEEIEAIGKAFPEYKLWLAYGEEMPEAGQISPMTKAAQKELGTQGEAG